MKNKTTRPDVIREIIPPSKGLELSKRLTLDDLCRDLRNISTSLSRITAVIAFISGTLFEEETKKRK